MGPDRKTQGILLVCLGVWLLPLSWTLYVKYARERRAEEHPALPLAVFLSITGVGMIGLLWFAYTKQGGAAALSSWWGATTTAPDDASSGM